MPNQVDPVAAEPPLATRSNEAAQALPVGHRQSVPRTGLMDVMGTPPVLLDILALWANQLLEQARNLLQCEEQEDFRLAVILAHAACDVQTEQAIKDLIIYRKIEYLKDALFKSMGRQISLGSDSVQRVYASLTGGDRPWTGEPPTAPWWSDWRDSEKRRNEVAHDGKRVTRQEATSSVEVGKKYVDHLLRVVGELRASNPNS